VVQWLALQTTNTEVPGSIPEHSLGFFLGSWVCNGVHSASWSDKLSSYSNKEVTVRFGNQKMQLWDSMCWPHVNPVPSGAVGRDCQRQLLSRPRFVSACSATDLLFFNLLISNNSVTPQPQWHPHLLRSLNTNVIAVFPQLYECAHVSWLDFTWWKLL
jgi:hypothetical protein